MWGWTSLKKNHKYLEYDFLLLSKFSFQITHMNGIYSITFFNTNHAFYFYQFHPAFIVTFSSFPSRQILCKVFLDKKRREGNTNMIATIQSLHL